MDNRTSFYAQMIKDKMFTYMNSQWDFLFVRTTLSIVGHKASLVPTQQMLVAVPHCLLQQPNASADLQTIPKSMILIFLLVIAISQEVFSTLLS